MIHMLVVQVKLLFQGWVTGPVKNRLLYHTVCFFLSCLELASFQAEIMAPQSVGNNSLASL